MATWPSASKASTTNLDSGTDSPAAARADIKTNVDNVNEIIDMFNIASPTNNQILQYSSANSRFEIATPTSGGNNIVIYGSKDIANEGSNYFVFETTTGAPQAQNYNILSTGGVSGVSRIDTYGSRAMILPAGTYIFEWAGAYTTNSNANFNIRLQDITNSITLKTIYFRAVTIDSNTYRYSEPQSSIIILSGTTTIRLETGTPPSSTAYIKLDIDSSGTTNIKFIKIA